LKLLSWTKHCWWRSLWISPLVLCNWSRVTPACWLHRCRFDQWQHLVCLSVNVFLVGSCDCIKLFNANRKYTNRVLKLISNSWRESTTAGSTTLAAQQDQDSHNTVHDCSRSAVIQACSKGTQTWLRGQVLDQVPSWEKAYRWMSGLAFTEKAWATSLTCTATPYQAKCRSDQ
jgi:hypothetical protein